MLQLRALNEAAAARLAAQGQGAVASAVTLEERVDAQVAALRAERLRLAAEQGPLTRSRALLDARVRTDRGEFFDDPELSEADRLRLARCLHVHNQAFLSYWRFARMLRPLLTAASAGRGGAPARVLELASGSGEFVLALARQGLGAEITGSDIQPAYVADAQARADEEGLGVRFRELDAFCIGEQVAPGAFDVVFIAQSVHHFRPGQLARMIAGARSVGAQVVAVDGYRGPLLLALLSVTGAASLWWPFWHDSVMSARKMYSEPELACIARLAAPGDAVQVRTVWPGYSMLVVG